MREFFPSIQPIRFEGSDTHNPLAFKHYDKGEIVLGKSMADHLRFAVCYWHTFQATGADPFGAPTLIRPWHESSDPMQCARDTLHAAFEFFHKLGVDFWCFHDRDIAPEADSLAQTNKQLDEIASLAQSLQSDHNKTLLWATANLFSHPRYMAGAATNPDPHVFAYAGAQVKKALEIAHQLGALGYVFWGGREGYDTLLNTDLKRETDHLARFLHLAVEHKKTIGFTGQFYIEPKPKEPTKHQYDFDAGNCIAFLRTHGLADHFKLNIEANHATLAAHTFRHELELAAAHDMLGSVDANRGDLLLGWDTDQFPTDLYDTTLAMLAILRAGGFKTGGLNFDAHVRRQSIDLEDLFHAHIGAMDAFARGLKIAARILEDGRLDEFAAQRYAAWNDSLGQQIESGHAAFADCEAYILQHGEPTPRSGRQELLENLLNEYI